MPVPFPWIAFGMVVPSSVIVGLPKAMPVHLVVIFTWQDVDMPTQVIDVLFAGESITI
jgi:hypothetical protein